MLHEEITKNYYCSTYNHERAKFISAPAIKPRTSKCVWARDEEISNSE